MEKNLSFEQVAFKQFAFCFPFFQKLIGQFDVFELPAVQIGE